MMAIPAEFRSFTEENASLAPHSYLRTDAEAEYLSTPETVEQLVQIVQFAQTANLPFRLLGFGTNVVIKEHRLPGFVIRLTKPAFTSISVKDTILTAGSGAILFDVIRSACQHHLAGLETLAGIKATIGGALRYNAGDRKGEIADHLRSITVVTKDGVIQRKDRSELWFGERASDIEEPIILHVDFQLDVDIADSILKRMRRSWINRKAELPTAGNYHLRMFRNPKGFSASRLIESTPLVIKEAGKAYLSDRNPNYIVANAGATSHDILTLIEATRTSVRQHAGVELEQELGVW
ncbi:MAG: FAD-binding protein [Zavarzinella sp.]